MKKLLAIALLSGTVYGGYRVIGGGGGGGDSVAKVESVKTTDRIWIDRLPRTERDAINVFLGITSESVGVFHNGSQWRASFELFRFEANDSELRVVYPQTGERETITAKATKCDERGFDYCLEVSGASRGVKKYFSMDGWEIDANATLHAATAKADFVVKTAKQP